ncbi:EAL domain-containing protein [Thiomicrorhabdus sp. ZW0627]|uniref:sensor domain-containing protein n=1 Tax=Thiomicrorhabdus sp. ZW0627 TaxID=3039774 RepID=UPI00243741E8|nr:EAL domain-containing protein [Thiomicrorhabdus sp. ZW0627]MDG6774549.1 EAL domain-containing protein [Thiomicrorhabdus sp. ZW0627]
MNSEKLYSQLELSDARLREEKESKSEIICAFHEAVIVFKPNLTPQIINAQAKLMFAKYLDTQQHIQNVPLYKNKKATVRFDLHLWLSKLLAIPTDGSDTNTPTEVSVWLKDRETLKTTPLLLSAKPLLTPERNLKNLLLVVYDRTIHAQSDEQKRLMEAAFNSYHGQFITNEKGYITHPNDSFCTLTGLDAETLKSMTLTGWLDQQVSLKITTNEVLTTLLSTRFWSGEVELHPLPNVTYYAVLSISLLADEQFNIEHYVVNIQNITEIHEAQMAIEQMAYYDDLTGLANRRLAFEHLDLALKHHKRHGTFAALFFINLDRFKSINDAFGRKTGDALLKQVAKILKDSLREEDTIARVGGDEFLVLTQDKAFSKTQATQNAYHLAKKIAKHLNKNYHINETTLNSTTCIGITVFPFQEGDTAEDLMLYADLAMSAAKKRTNQKIYFYESSLSEIVIERRSLEHALTIADLDEQFELHYQAQIGPNGQLHGAESLIRWNHPELGTIPPNKFIPIAEEGRQILRLGDWILAKAFQQSKEWCQKQPDFNLSINISPIQFHEADFVQQTIKILNECGANPKNITLELTEGVLISDTQSALKKIEDLTKLGFNISIDDFGTGYSSLSYLQKLPIHELKIDKSFIFRVPESQDDIAIVESIISLARNKNLLIVAEGVETEQQADFLRQQPDDIIMQGYLFSEPCSKTEFEKFFSSAE